MKLADLLPALPGATVLGNPEVGFDRVVCRPEAVRGGSLFAAIDEFLVANRWAEGAGLVPQALERGTVAILAAAPLPDCPVPQVIVAEPRRALATCARWLHGAPDAALPVIGVTGTNGKTSTTGFLGHLLGHTLGKAGHMGTLGVFESGRLIEESEYTTALAPEVFGRLAGYRARGVKAVAMEVSSHALELDRVAGLEFAAAICTNLTRDHLDFHGTWEAYRAAKGRLFAQLKPGTPAILNRDDDAWSWFAERGPGRVVTFSIDHPADYRATEVHCGDRGSSFILEHAGQRHAVRLPLVGRFQVANVLAALAAAHSLGADLASLCAAATSLPTVPGRMEAYALPNGASAVIDYAHNPDGLQNLITNARSLQPRRLLLVFGCGGDRDRGKRPLMGRIGAEQADLCWITSDNPRTEDPQRILADILAGCPQRERLHVELDRTAAIQAAYAASQPGDLLVLAGKGHEDYQIIGTTKLPYSDHAVVRGLTCATGGG